MLVSSVNVDCAHIHDWDSFDDEFSRVFAFPPFYGRNMNAWIDCMSSLDAPEEGMTGIHCKAGAVLTIMLIDAGSLKRRCPEQYSAIVDCAAFVNRRRLVQSQSPVLMLVFDVNDVS